MNSSRLQPSKQDDTEPGGSAEDLWLLWGLEVRVQDLGFRI